MRNRVGDWERIRSVQCVEATIVHTGLLKHLVPSNGRGVSSPPEPPKL